METLPEELIVNPEIPQKPIVDSINRANTALHNTIDKISEMLRPGVENITSEAHKAADKLADTATATAEKLDLKSEYLKDLGTRCAAYAKNHVREKPLSSIGYAILTGVVINRIFHSR